MEERALQEYKLAKAEYQNHHFMVTVLEERLYKAIIAADAAEQSKFQALQLNRYSLERDLKLARENEQLAKTAMDDLKKVATDLGMPIPVKVAEKKDDKKPLEAMKLNVKGAPDAPPQPVTSRLAMLVGSEFNDYKLKCLKKDPKAQQPGYELKPGSPAMHVFTFPDEKSKRKFIEQLVDKKYMEVVPGSGGSQIKPTAHALEEAKKPQYDKIVAPPLAPPTRPEIQHILKRAEVALKVVDKEIDKIPPTVHRGPTG